MKKIKGIVLVFVNMTLFMILAGLGSMEDHYIEVIFVMALILGIFGAEAKILDLNEKLEEQMKKQNKRKKHLNSNNNGHLYDWAKDEI